MLQSRLQRRLRVLELDSLDAYQDYLFNSPDGEEELRSFFDAVTTNKTDFFREPDHFDYLTQTVLPTLGIQHHSPWLFKLWCAGCSTGEEPYTLSMVLSEYALSHPGFDFSIFATDISTRVLAHAQQAIYPESVIGPISHHLRQKYLLRSRKPEEQRVRIIPALRQRLQFARLNFMDDHYPVQEMFEVIFFRNVLIYFSKETQEQVIRKLCRHLVPGGYLFVGHAESLSGLKIPVTSVGKLVYRKSA